MKNSEELAEICLKHQAIDIFVAEHAEKQDEILSLRSMVYEALKPKTIEILDVVCPRSQMLEHALAVEEISRKYDVWLPTYGHAGDGNLHTHIMKVRRNREDIQNWEEVYHAARHEIHTDAIKRGGKASGEHGIGLVKKEYLGLFLSEVEINLMKRIKYAFDPSNILNPGKIFD